MMADQTKPNNAHVDQRLREEPIIWFTTVRADGRPHTVPVWFLWDGETFLIFSQPGNLKIRNLQRNPHITLALPPDVIEALRPLAQEEDRSLNGEIVQAVREYIAKRRKERTGAVPFHDQTIIAVRLADGRICVAAKEEAKGELEQFDEPGLFSRYVIHRFSLRLQGVKKMQE